MKKILYYNWLPFDNFGDGGGVNVYQYNLIEEFIKDNNYQIYFLSSGYKYNPLIDICYIKETKNVFGDKCKSFEVINSPIIAPSARTCMNLNRFNNDKFTPKLFYNFVKKYGPFDVIHFQNFEGISENVLGIKKKLKNTKFIFSAHNYQPLCPTVQYFQTHNKHICYDYNEGKECTKCAHIPNKDGYVNGCRNYLFEFPLLKHQFIKSIVIFLIKLLRNKANKYIGTHKNIKAEYYKNYRLNNVKQINENADLVLAVSEKVKHILVQNGVSPKIIKVSYIGTKIANEAQNCALATSKFPFTITYLGYARVDKGFFFFIDALSKLDIAIKKQIHVVLGAKNINKKAICDILKDFNKVTIYNGYRHEDLKDILKDTNLGIVPVLWEDNLPQVAIEMVANGVPILCSSFGGASELCNDDRFKFTGGDAENFIKKLEYFIQNPTMLDEFWMHNKKLVTMPMHVEELKNLYKEPANI